jgi:hypothetical protein
MIGLTVEERGAYYTLIDLQYSRAPHNHVTDELIIRALSVRPQVWRRLKTGLIAKGKVHETDGKLTANRVETQVKLVMLRGGFRSQIEENQELKPDRREKPEERSQKKKRTYTKRELVERVVRASRAHPLPEGWSPKVGVVNMTPVDLFELGKFRDYALAKNRLCADWEAAWRNWQKQEWYGNGYNQQSITSPDALEARRKELQRLRNLNGGIDDEEARAEVRRNT